MKDIRDFLETCFTVYRGRTIGILCGLLFGLLVLLLGFWRVVFVAVCIAIGYWIGSFRDKKETFLTFLDRILPGGTRNKIQ